MTTLENPNLDLNEWEEFVARAISFDTQLATVAPVEAEEQPDNVTAQVVIHCGPGLIMMLVAALVQLNAIDLDRLLSKVANDINMQIENDRAMPTDKHEMLVWMRDTAYPGWISKVLEIANTISFPFHSKGN